ncbi:2-oxoglutarate dehydrogenase complex dihydrolipoyllysine-residue succinyltransferase [Legionella spiritensis]|uniref:2-oxoglutarate dehydrogenase complex dihydrolipoyllysine-residue succinyltransferase n=1 Tax=Legionella spiritensis TaxID=452 RepID=UPI000F6F8B15|nr:2-oxoglutarate dehydrogenase complex dihydrolipoyllysine-residue succinyltransferase [Legionella spiritensis]VEG91362.1 dihydrolipoamide succinyltransferase subunit E2 [Legionella spiritensis]
MSIEVKVPALPESVADATIAAWHKKVGDRVTRDENLVDLETDKVVLEVPAPADGILKEICFAEGDTVEASQVLARLEKSSAADDASGNDENKSDEDKKEEKSDKDEDKSERNKESESSEETKATSPAVRRMLAENDLSAEEISGSGKDGRLTKEDVLAFIKTNREKSTTKSAGAQAKPQSFAAMGEREERRVPMTRLRARIAERLLEAQHNAAMLTTFNEVNLKAVMDLRAQYKDSFEKKHGVKLGFMSFFTKAVVESLKRFPAVNASIDGQDIVYHGYYDIGIAVSTERGLVVPVVRDADQMSMADVEKAINDAATRARQGKLAMEEMQGGTFTITNGGVFGSLLATPIINPPQTGILGMHKIEDRPIVEKGQIVIRPMMYVALSYDHRLIDGKESVQFLVSVKELLEDPSRLLLNI